MPLELQYTPDQGVIFKGSGKMTGEETLAANSGLVDEILQGRSVTYQLVDLLDVEEFSLSSSDMRRLAVQDIRLLQTVPHIRIAIVVKNLSVFGMNRMYSSYLQTGTRLDNCELFNDLFQAKEWIEESLNTMEIHKNQ